MLSGILAKVAATIISIISAGGYLGVTLLMAIESACIPLPSEVIMPFAGYLVHTGQFNLWIVATAGAIGCNLGSIVGYEIGFHGGRPMVERFGRYVLLNRHDLEIAEHFFDRHGAIAIFIGRLLPVVRTFIALPAGVARMPRVRFHIYTFLGSWPWCLALAYIGMKLGNHWDTLGKYFHRFDALILVALLIGIALFLRSHWKNRMRAVA
ncbi:MAG: DedA family protein [Acidobacteriaceae bacterium]